jgi:hypothetical protein
MNDAGVLQSLATTLVLFVVVAAVALPVIVSRLRRHHPAVWSALCPPGSSALQVAWRLIRFAISLRHLRLDDLTLSLACVALALGILAVLAGVVGWGLARLSSG